jgi:hypothetical protein
MNLFILSYYRPTVSQEYSWNLSDDQHSVILISSIYCWHIMITFIFLFIELCLIKAIFKLFLTILVEIHDFICSALMYIETLSHIQRRFNF